jgi:hypothetical protein
MRRAKDVRRLVVEKRREHSRKPDCVRDRIERLVAGPYLELFSRETKQGWGAAEMLQPDLAAVWQERDQHRNAATIGAVDVWPKFSQQKAFLHAGLQPHTENDERTA